MMRSVTFGALAAAGVPMALRRLEGELGDFIRGISQHAEVAGISLSWSWAIFALVTLLSFILLQLSRD